MLITRRSLLRGLVAAPAIIAIDRLMPVKVWEDPILTMYRGKAIMDAASYYAPYIPFKITSRVYDSEARSLGFRWISVSDVPYSTYIVRKPQHGFDYTT